MNAGERISKFQEFFDEHYKSKLLDIIKKGRSFIAIDFKDLSLFDIELSELLLEDPDETIMAAELAIRQMDLGDIDNKLRVRFGNIPSSQKVLIRDIRKKHLEKLITINGTVRQKSKVMPQTTLVRYECPACGNVIPVLQVEKKIREPSSCGCGRRGKFKELGKEKVDFQGIDLEEIPIELEDGSQPQRIKLFLKEDLVSPKNDRRTNPGTAINVVGILKDSPIPAKDGGVLTKGEFIIEVNNIIPLEEDMYSIKISEKDLKEIRRLSRMPDIFQKMADSFAPGIYGHEKIKEAMLLQFFSGVRKQRNDGVATRGDIHVLLVGDPGGGKSGLLKRAEVIAPKARYVAGKGVSGAGLTAAAVKDEFIGGWALEAGALVLANKGVCIIDELDKVGDSNRDHLHEGLEQQTVTVDKANIHAKLPAETTVLAAANPKLSRFDSFKTVAEQIDLPASLINRFDLIFPIRDLPDPKTDREKAEFVTSMHEKGDVEEGPIPTEMLRKYISYARKNIRPKLTKDAKAEMVDFYVRLRNQDSSMEKNFRSVPINLRQQEALIRLSEASAKSRLSKVVTVDDAKKAIELLYACMSQIGIDPETGKIDMDRVETGMSTSKRNEIINVREIINKLTEKIGKMVPIDDIVKEADSHAIDDEQVDEAIAKLKRSGDIFEPKRGFIQKI